MCEQIFKKTSPEEFRIQLNVVSNIYFPMVVSIKKTILVEIKVKFNWEKI